jgi:hypothetical protein
VFVVSIFVDFRVVFFLGVIFGLVWVTIGAHDPCSNKILRILARNIHVYNDHLIE